jgi:hypothetical protein
MKAVQLVLLLLLAAGCAIGQDRKLGPMDGQDLPPADLERVRDSTLVTLSSFKGKENIILVFYRGYW